MPQRRAAVFLLANLSLLPAAGVRADYAEGHAAEMRGEHARALREYVAAADVDARAAAALARLHAQPGGAGNADKSLRWLRRAGELGDAQAQYRLGLRYLRGGAGTRQEPREAAIWFERAAQQGHAAARFELGRLLASGPSAEPGRAQALIQDAAEAGVREAQASLGQAVAPEARHARGGEEVVPVLEGAPYARRLPNYWDEAPPRVTLHLGMYGGHGGWGWSLGHPYPWYAFPRYYAPAYPYYSPEYRYSWNPYARRTWGGSPWAWDPYGCRDPWCSSPPHRRSGGSVRFGVSIGN